MLTQDELRRQLDYNKNTGVFTWKINKRGPVKAGMIANCVDSGGYILIGIMGKRYRAHRLAWLYNYGYLPEKNVDHINGNRLDNRIINLREASQSCNIRNSGNFSNSKSGVRGVIWDKSRDMWYVSIVIHGKSIFIARCDEFTEAVCYRFCAEQCYGWHFCKNETPSYKYLKRKGVLHDRYRCN